CGAQNFVAARMAVLVVDFLETMEIDNDNSQRKAIAASAVQFFFERFREEAAVIQTGERIRDRIQLNFLQLVVLENHGNANEAGRGKNIHEHGFQRDGAAESVGEF